MTSLLGEGEKPFCPAKKGRQKIEICPSQGRKREPALMPGERRGTGRKKTDHPEQGGGGKKKTVSL